RTLIVLHPHLESKSAVAVASSLLKPAKSSNGSSYVQGYSHDRHRHHTDTSDKRNKIIRNQQMAGEFSRRLLCFCSFLLALQQYRQWCPFNKERRRTQTHVHSTRRTHRHHQKLM
ncbi:unnamed protein product, partial [Ectocarpus sp. 8 AP-2014]